MAGADPTRYVVYPDVGKETEFETTLFPFIEMALVGDAYRATSRDSEKYAFETVFGLKSDIPAFTVAICPWFTVPRSHWITLRGVPSDIAIIRRARFVAGVPTYLTNNVPSDWRNQPIDALDRLSAAFVTDVPKVGIGKLNPVPGQF